MSANLILGEIFRDVAKALRPPPVLSYSAWAAKEWRLPDSSAQPGRYRPWKPQREILDAIGDPTIEFVDVVKGTRIGFTTMVCAAVGADMVNDPCAVIVLMPTDDDARGLVVDEIDPAFDEVPALRGLMPGGRYDSRNTLTQRYLPSGGSLKVLAARSPRNLRRHTAKKIYGDEVDAMELTREGDPIKLGIKRTDSYADRKGVFGSSPTEDVVSIIVRRYNESDQRVFEWPCPLCGVFFEPQWQHIEWPDGKPELAVCRCPHCKEPIEERHKPAMIEAGSFRITKPEVKGHAGFRFPTLISLQPKATWGILAQEYLEAQRAGTAYLKVFYNTVLALPWSSALEHVDEHALMARAEKFGVAWDEEKSRWREDIPPDVLYITVGCDVQPDRFECTLWGWSRTENFVLGHHIIRGPTNLETTWAELDAFLSTTWKHPLGNRIGIEAAAVDSGDGNRTQQVYDFCGPRAARRIVAIKGAGGPRPTIERSKAKRKKYADATVYIVGTDQGKQDILTLLSIERGQLGAIRFSETLDNEWFVQFTSERRVLVVLRGRPKVEWHRIPGRQAEALDASVYARAVRHICRFDNDRREAELTAGFDPPKGNLKKIVGRLHGNN